MLIAVMATGRVKGETVEKPCSQCPWRKSNQGKRTPWGFFTAKNLRRLWNQIRSGGRPQSCHLTDPSNLDHVAAGAPANAKPKECPGSVILVLREVQRVVDIAAGEPIEPEHIDQYLKERPKGLKKKGLLYWMIARIQMGKMPFMSEGELPEVDVADVEIGLPAILCPAANKGVK